MSYKKLFADQMTHIFRIQREKSTQTKTIFNRIWHNQNKTNYSIGIKVSLTTIFKTQLLLIIRLSKIVFIVQIILQLYPPEGFYVFFNADNVLSQNFNL